MTLVAFLGFMNG